MSDVSASPCFPGQWSTDEERAATARIWQLLQEYAHRTGAAAGDDVLSWFATQTAWTAPAAAPPTGSISLRQAQERIVGDWPR